MEAEPSGLAGLPIVLIGLFIFTLAILGSGAAKRSKNRSPGSTGDAGASYADDGDCGGGDSGGD